jgi:hypothetical protein
MFPELKDPDVIPFPSTPLRELRAHDWWLSEVEGNYWWLSEVEAAFYGSNW